MKRCTRGAIVEPRRLRAGPCPQRPVLDLGELNDPQQAARRKSRDALNEATQLTEPIHLFPEARDLPPDVLNGLPERTQRGGTASLTQRHGGRGETRRGFRGGPPRNSACSASLRWSLRRRRDILRIAVQAGVKSRRAGFASGPTAENSTEIFSHPMRRRRLTPTFTHGTLHFCIAMTGTAYPILYPQPVTSSGDSRAQSRRPKSEGAIPKPRSSGRGSALSAWRMEWTHVRCYGFERGSEGKTISPAEELGHRFGARADLEFFVNAPDVGVDGFVADAEFLRDFLVEKTLGEAVEDFLLAR
jgi:hypothetical protein